MLKAHILHVLRLWPLRSISSLHCEAKDDRRHKEQREKGPTINRAQLLSDRVNRIPREGGLRSPEASVLARAAPSGARRWEVMFMHLMRENSRLLSTIKRSALDVKSCLSHQHILSQLETVALYSIHSMRQLEALGSSPLLKSLATDLWILLWTILFIHLMWGSSRLLSTKICSVLVLDVKSRLSRQHVLSQ